MSKSGQIFESMDLISAAGVGDYGTVEQILKSKQQNVNAVNASGWTALMYAANYGHYNIIRLLIRYDCDVNQRDWQGRTALMLAATNGHTRSIEVLINYGKADKNLKDLSGTSAYQYAKKCGHGNNKLIKSLLLNSSKSFPYELKGRSEPQINVKDNKKETYERPNEMTSDYYNPCASNAFSSSVWKPITSDPFKEYRFKKPFKGFGDIGSTESLSSVDEGALSSSQSSQCSAISLPRDFKRKPTSFASNYQIPNVMPNTLFHLLTRLDLIQYLDLFESNGIDFYQFLTLTDSDFQKLGINSFGHRKKLSIAQMRFHESLDIDSPQESFLTDFLLNERDLMKKQIQDLEQKLKELSSKD